MNEYIGLMTRTVCMVGNSSSGIREGAFIGTPFVNIGTRQERRVRGKNCIDTGYSFEEIRNSIMKIMNTQTYTNNTYGDGTAATRMLEILKNIEVSPQKVITY